MKNSMLLVSLKCIFIMLTHMEDLNALSCKQEKKILFYFLEQQ